MQLSLPQMGYQRQKNTRNAVAQQLADAIARSKGLGRFAKLGQGRSARFNNPFVGSAGRFAQQHGTAKPDLLGLRGPGERGMMENRGLGMGGDTPDVHVQPPAALPTDYLTGVPTPANGGPPQAVPGGVGSNAQSIGFDGQGNPILHTVDQTQAQLQSLGQGAHVNPNGSVFEGSLLSYGPSPSSALTIGGYIPLGNGVFYDPTAQRVVGAGGRAIGG